MRLLCLLLRANHCPARLLSRRPALSAPPSLIYPTKCFTTTLPRHRFQISQRKEPVTMPTEMTTLKGEPFDRASLESLIKVCHQDCARRVTLTAPASTLLHACVWHLRRCCGSLRLRTCRICPHRQHCGCVEAAFRVRGRHAARSRRTSPIERHWN